MYSNSSPSLTPINAPTAPNFLVLSAALANEDRQFLVLSSDVRQAVMSGEQIAALKARSRSESTASTTSTASDASISAGRRWMSNNEIAEDDSVMF
ncbi:hypothetical protein V1512DRAFT_264623 [Lipomyces arxii]|uniref:uncharacterized protein n=1 Tax=Lipomyces arxii TaxID=56418 RepID=UPI0034CFD506